MGSTDFVHDKMDAFGITCHTTRDKLLCFFSTLVAQQRPEEKVCSNCFGMCVLGVFEKLVTGKSSNNCKNEEDH